MKSIFFITLILVTIGCNEQSRNNDNGSSGTSKKATGNFKEGEDFLVYERVRLLDKVGFTEPQEAYSLLLPEGWKQDGEIIWNAPGSSCAGTFKKLKASDPSGDYSFELLPDLIYVWNTNQELQQFNRSNQSSPYCETREPVDAEAYLRNIFIRELDNAEIIEVRNNPHVVDEMKEHNESTIRELQSYGAGPMEFKQTAVNATLKWPDGSEGLVTLGVTILEGIIPNNYNGTYDKLYTTQVTKRSVFKYPSRNRDEAKSMFTVMMSSFRSNPAWNDAVNRFWRQARQQSHTAHVGRIRMMDEQTRQMGEQAIRKGQERLQAMDSEMRSWEQRQSSQDRMHTEFIKTIREVENYRDETGKYEMTAGYDQVWSRGDGSRFILSNNPNFDPSSVFQDQAWKQMKKVR